MLCVEELSPEKKISVAKLELVKKYFLTLSRFRRFVIANKNKQVKFAIKHHVSQQLKIIGGCADNTIIQRDCLILLQLSKAL